MVSHPYNIMNEITTPLSFNKDSKNKILNIHIISSNGDLDIKLKYNSTIKNIKEEIQRIYKYIPKNKKLFYGTIDIKEKIQNIKNKKLFYGAIELKDDYKKITDYEITDGSIIYLIERESRFPLDLSYSI